MTLDLDAVVGEFLQQCGPCDGGLSMGCTCSPRDFRGTMSALVDEVKRLREWQRTISDACGLTEIHAGYSPHVPDATPGIVALIQDAFTRSLHHAECERVEWEESVARGEIDGMATCPECKTGAHIEEESEEQSGYEEQERNYWVVRLDCGHEIATEIRR